MTTPSKSTTFLSGTGSGKLPAVNVLDPLRLAALDDIGILDTPPEQGFEDIVRLATRLCAAPVALVSFVAADRQWFKARIGFPSCETDLNSSVCQYALAEPDLLVIEDLAADPRTATNPLVTGDPLIRFYAGAPLRLPDGLTLGSLCVIDTQPRPGGLTDEQADDLRALARQVSNLLSMRQAVHVRDQLLNEQQAKIRQARRVEVLARASAALLTATDPAAVLDPILTASAGTLGFDRSYTYDLWPDSRNLRLTHSLNASEDVQAYLRNMPYGAPLCGIVAETRQPLILSELQASDLPAYQNARGIGLDAYAGYPLMSRGSLRGVISFASSRVSTFDEGTLGFFQTVARLMSAVYERLDSEKALRESDERSRLAQEAGRIGTFEANVTSSLVRVSAELCRIYGVPEAGVYSLERLTELVIPEDRAIPATHETIRDGSASAEAEYRIRRANDGALRVISRVGRFVRDAGGVPLRMVGTVQDVTDQRQVQDELRRTGERYRMAARATNDAIWDWDLASNHVLWNEALTVAYGHAAADIVPTGDWWIEHIHSDDRSHVEASIHSIIEGDETVWTDEYRFLRADGTYAHVLDRGFVIRDEDGRATRMIGAMLDLTERKRAEAELRLLNEEMSHRLKNNLTMVLSIATQTLRSVSDKGPVEAFEDRIHALAAAHDLLLKKAWASAPFDAVAAAVLDNFAQAGRIDLSGPEVILGPQATLSISLLLHELATNAAKYGSLTNETGRVRVTLRLDGENERQDVRLSWEEFGGPPVRVPTRRGIGSRLISMGLVGNGNVELHYAPSGFRAEMRAPLARLQPSKTASPEG